MARFLYTWELGNNLGHVGAFLPVARRLQDDGHHVELALRDPSAAGRLDRDRGVSVRAAPPLEERPRPHDPLSHADILWRFGFSDAGRLESTVRGWLEIFAATRPDVLAADYAPMALLAARIARLPTMIFGTGFYTPPARAPLPALRPWLPLPAGELAAIEAPVLDAANAVAIRLGAAPMQALHELFAVGETALLGFPETDHFADRGPAAYWGNTLVTTAGDPPPWPTVPGPRLFAYLRAGTRHLEPMLQALNEFDGAALVVCPDLPVTTFDHLAGQLRNSGHLRLVRDPVRLDRALAEADAGITYAGFSTTVAILQAGKPVLLLPSQLEQFLLARRIEQAGMGYLIHPERPPHDLGRRLAALLAVDGPRLAAREFAERYRDFTPERVVANIARRLAGLANGG